MNGNMSAVKMSKIKVLDSIFDSSEFSWFIHVVPHTDIVCGIKLKCDLTQIGWMKCR